MDLLFWIGSFVISLIILIKSADIFTESAEKIGLAFKIPSFIVGVAIVSIGTSLPELATSIIGVMKNDTEIAAANAIGSNIANILLIVGMASIVAKKISIKRSLINLDLPLLASVTTLIVFILQDKQVTRIEGAIAVCTYLIYTFYLVSSGKERKALAHKDNGGDSELPVTRLDRLKILKRLWKHHEKIDPKVFAYLIASSIFIYLGANQTVESIIKIAEEINVDSSLIVMSAMALGTSLPELIVSVQAAKKKKYEIALGNVFGSNIFNALIVIGLPAIITPLAVDEKTYSVGIPFLIATTILYVFSGISRKIYNWEGMMYIMIYVLFLVKIFE
ncbi:MAG: calcium/sodium antiporter [Candidatus Pacebacteria bacterium]|nr:calcium/sodium antiporter [Candidatus Paceibacterota bacterium]